MDWKQREFREQLLIDTATDDTALACTIGGIAIHLIPDLDRMNGAHGSSRSYAS
jgi:hypothetical protein